MRRLALLVLAGCGVSFPSEEKVEDLRILEIRTSPPEISVFRQVDVDATAEELTSLTPNFDPVRLTALVAHPDLDAAIDVEWIRCRNEDGGGFFRIPCEGRFKDRLGVGTSTVVRPIELAFADIASLGGGFESAIDILASDPRDLFSGFRTFFNMQATVSSAAVEADTRLLEGTKRLLIFDPSIVALVLREARARGAGAIPMIAGVELPTLCTNVSETQFTAVLDYLQARQPNRAPSYASIDYALETITGTVAYVPGETIMVRPGESVVLRGRAATEDKEHYRVIDDKCALLDFSETMAWSWFTNVGDLSDQITSEGEEPSADEFLTTWRAPPEGELVEEVTRVRIWSVLRDGRGGSDSRVIDLVISKSG